MPSQIEMLEEEILAAEKRLGPGAPVVKDYKQQLASMKSRAEQRASGNPPPPNPVTLTIGMRGKK